LEPVSGYLALAEKLWSAGATHADAWNFGPSIGAAKPVEWITQYIAAGWGNGVKWHVDGAKHHRESLHLHLNSAKSRSRLGWSTLLTLRETLNWTVSWYKRFYSGEDARDITLEQIRTFMKLDSQKVREIA
jgi:CDP-glucose 4,6-dehydratase